MTKIALDKQNADKPEFYYHCPTHFIPIDLLGLSSLTSDTVTQALDALVGNAALADENVICKWQSIHKPAYLLHSLCLSVYLPVALRVGELLKLVSSLNVEVDGGV